MKSKAIARRLLPYEAVGFAMLVSVSWMDELLDLPSLLFGGAPGHKIGIDDKWVSMEAYLHQELQVTATHGMCPECFKNLEKNLGAAARNPNHA